MITEVKNYYPESSRILMYRNEQQRKKKDDTCPVDFIIAMYDSRIKH